MVKHGVDDNPNDEWPYEPEMDAEKELMDLAEAHWQKSLITVRESRYPRRWRPETSISTRIPGPIHNRKARTPYIV